MTCACLKGGRTDEVVGVRHDLHVGQEAHALLAALVIRQAVELRLPPAPERRSGDGGLQGRRLRALVPNTLFWQVELLQPERYGID